MAELRPRINSLDALQGKKNKIDVNYRNVEKCQMCDFFLNGRCEQVEGNISAEATCDLWQIKSLRGGIDAKFYVDEYNKRKK